MMNPKMFLAWCAGFGMGSLFMTAIAVVENRKAMNAYSQRTIEREALIINTLAPHAPHEIIQQLIFDIDFQAISQLEN